MGSWVCANGDGGSIANALCEEWELRNCSQLNRRNGRTWRERSISLSGLLWACLCCSALLWVWVGNNPLRVSISRPDITNMTFRFPQNGDVRRNLLFSDQNLIWFRFSLNTCCDTQTHVFICYTVSPHTVHVPLEQLLDSKPSVTLALKAPCKTTTGNFSSFNFCSFWQLHLFFRARHEYFRPEWQIRWRMKRKREWGLRGRRSG